MNYDTSENQNYQELQNPNSSYSKSQNSSGSYSKKQQNPSAPATRTKKRIRKPTLHQIPTTIVFLHVYFKNLAAGYTDKDFFKYIKGPLNSYGLDKFQELGIQIELINNSSSFATDFEKSLNTPGAVVIYFGHTVLGRKKTLGLTPVISKQPKITSRKLVRLLNKSKAKVVLLAGCATDGCVRKVKGDTVVIVTQSGKDRLTNTL